jgi:mRNA interferase HigB
MIKPSRIKQYANDVPEAAAELMAWLKVASRAEWKSFVEVRANCKDADLIPVASGRVVVCFNIRHNRFRLIVAINYKYSMVYVLRFFLHKEYDRKNWENDL